jgi:hypothetical protein
MTLRLNGSTSGYTEIDAPAVAGSNTLVLPGGNGTADQVLATNGSGTLSFVDRGRMVLTTAQNSTSGTAIDFTGIPSWVKKITVMFNGVSTNGTSLVQLQLGAGSFVTSGYLSTAGQSVDAATNTVVTLTSGFGVLGTAAGNVRTGHHLFTNISGNTWVYSSMGVFTDVLATWYGGGTIGLSGTLDRIRITTVNGTDTFDAGSINILYEG